MSIGAEFGDLIGSTLAGRYRILERRGEGGMATVFAAHHVTLDAKVAVKVLHPNLARDARQRKRFVREARSANRIVHEHVVNIFDFAEEPTPYFVMEYLEGEDLAALVHRTGGLPWMRVREIGLQVLSALDAAHRLGVVHRDIKPSNIFMVRRPDGRDWVKVLDFGVAKVAGSSGETRGMTRTNEVLGTVLYMSPEQALGGLVDLRSDLYSLGVVFHHLLTGVVPFDGTNPFQVIHQHLSAAPPALPADCPAAVQNVVMRALAKAPEDRFPNAQAMAEALTLSATAAAASAPVDPHLSESLGFRPGPMQFAPPPSVALVPPTPVSRSSPWIFTGDSAADGPEPAPTSSDSRFSTAAMDREVQHEQRKRKRAITGWAAPAAVLGAIVLTGTWWGMTSPSHAPEHVASTPGISAPPRESSASHAPAAFPVRSEPLPKVSQPSAAPLEPLPAPLDPSPEPPAPLPASPQPPAAISPPPAPSAPLGPAEGPQASSDRLPAPAEPPAPSSERPAERVERPAARRPAAVTSTTKEPRTQPHKSSPTSSAPASSDGTVLSQMQRALANQCSRHDPGAHAKLELEITREGKAYPEIRDVNAAGKACIRGIVRQQRFAAGKSRSHTLRVSLRK